MMRKFFFAPYNNDETGLNQRGMFPEFEGPGAAVNDKNWNFIGDLILDNTEKFKETINHFKEKTIKMNKMSHRNNHTLSDMSDSN